jgi:hypothetical protein
LNLELSAMRSVSGSTRPIPRQKNFTEILPMAPFS